jgi:hypothetical protein
MVSSLKKDPQFIPTTDEMVNGLNRAIVSIVNSSGSERSAISLKTTDEAVDALVMVYLTDPSTSVSTTEQMPQLKALARKQLQVHNEAVAREQQAQIHKAEQDKELFLKKMVDQNRVLNATSTLFKHTVALRAEMQITLSDIESCSVKIQDLQRKAAEITQKELSLTEPHLYHNLMADATQAKQTDPHLFVKTILGLSDAELNQIIPKSAPAKK